ncbi:hypothetical protein ABZZ79_11350 [Streptomyces sp. NPDC006458]|uniref:hypothetical protein n=1 Tax=Streptomyces sp. NPDC006458 TaxID=3154302 RepID=UPI0033BE5D8A
MFPPRVRPVDQAGGGPGGQPRPRAQFPGGHRAGQVEDVCSADAWNRGDGTAYGRHFTDVTHAGTVYRGGAEIGRAHQDLFDSFLKGTTLTLEIVDLRLLGPGTAVAVTRGGRRARRLDKRASYTVVRGREDGRRRIAAVRKTAHRRLTEAFSFRLRPATRPAAWPSRCAEMRAVTGRLIIEGVSTTGHVHSEQPSAEQAGDRPSAAAWRNLAMATLGFTLTFWAWNLIAPLASGCTRRWSRPGRWARWRCWPSSSPSTRP